MIVYYLKLFFSKETNKQTIASYFCVAHFLKLTKVFKIVCNTRLLQSTRLSIDPINNGNGVIGNQQPVPLQFMYLLHNEIRFGLAMFARNHSWRHSLPRMGYISFRIASWAAAVVDFGWLFGPNFLSGRPWWCHPLVRLYLYWCRH